VDLPKAGFTFCHALYIPNEMERLESPELARCTPCAGDLEAVAVKISTVHAELLMIHHFRERNGRLARWIADLMSFQAGFPAPQYNLAGAKKEAYFAALRRGFLGDVTDLTALFVSWIEAGTRRRPSSRRLK
jgi:cell filamentation protein